MDSSDGTPARNQHILLADDELDALHMLALVLRQKGFEVTTAVDGNDALSKLHSQRPDVALLDIGMPVMSGYEVARRIRREPWAKSMLLVAVTGWDRDRDRARAYAAGFDLHLAKPVRADMLERLIVASREEASAGSPIPEPN